MGTYIIKDVKVYSFKVRLVEDTFNFSNEYGNKILLKILKNTMGASLMTRNDEFRKRRGKIWTISRFVRVILAQGPC